MPSPVESGNTDSEAGKEERRPLIAAHELSDRYVFTESDNTDGWIASDLTIDVNP